MRPLWILFMTLSFSWVSCPLNGQEPEEGHKRPSTQQQEKSHTTPTSQTVVIQTHLDAAPNKKHDQEKAEGTPKQSHDWIDKLNAFSTFIIAVFTIGMVIVIGIQIREYRIKERAWIAFLFPDQPILRDVDSRGRAENYRIIGFIKNVGNTPATIIKKFHFTSIVEKGENLESDSSIPEN